MYNAFEKAWRYLQKCNKLEEANGKTQTEVIEMAREVQRSRYEDDARNWFEVITVVEFWSESNQEYLETEHVAGIYKTQKRAETAANKLGGRVRKVFGFNNYDNYVDEAF